MNGGFAGCGATVTPHFHPAALAPLYRCEARHLLCSRGRGERSEGPHILGCFAEAPRLATAVLWASSWDEAMMVEHLVNLGRRSAVERMAHLLMELGVRLNLVGVGDRTGFPCPLTQYHLADALGLSAIHVNRVLRQLR